MTADAHIAAKAIRSIERKTSAERIEALFRGPKFQFNAAHNRGYSARFGLVRQGQKDHYLNRPVQVNRRAYGMASSKRIPC
jgi:hypothetical protein